MAKKPEQLTRDPYEVLNVEKTASQQEIKTAFRRLALAYHPDKNQGENAEVAAERFKDVAAAYNILSDPEKRHKFDVGGLSSLEPSDMEMEVDISALGTVNTALAAMFSKLGVPIKTTIAPQVLEATYAGNFTALPLRFGHPIQNKVEKAGAQYYELTLSEKDIADGFVIGAYSLSGSRFKLLMFEKAAPEGQWELMVQEDSSRIRKKMQIAGLFFLPFETYRIGPRPSALEISNDPEAILFRRLDSMAPRETAPLRPGTLLVAVYGDNWFNRVQYVVEAVKPELGRGAEEDAAAPLPAARMQDMEADLWRRREELRTFEQEYRQAQTRYLDACTRFTELQADVDELLMARDEAMLSLLARPNSDAKGATIAPVEHANGGGGAFARVSLGRSAPPPRPRALGPGAERRCLVARDFRCGQRGGKGWGQVDPASLSETADTCCMQAP